MTRQQFLTGALAALLILGAAPAGAHHGWSWTEDETFELRGKITKIYVGNPHATLDVDSAGEVWRVRAGAAGPDDCGRLHPRDRHRWRPGHCDRQSLEGSRRAPDEGGAHYRQRKDL